MAAENQEENPKETNQQPEKQQKQVIGEWKSSTNLINSAENCAKFMQFMWMCTCVWHMYGIL